ncbi:enolase C-terminal domain-like protein [Rubellimicrobium arenae]|uniref:enolase C-terminal domain-like protein n=1 Tax=Rubellimicrobium arenae TaxID=2817372 RepID=UPI001B30399B|nr:enolase C-terminal domain-like protein [Rubellimicrobium arenae]
MNIIGFTAWLFEVDPGPRFLWRDGLPGSHGELPGLAQPRRVALRMETDSGLTGEIILDRGEQAFDLIRRRFHHFVGADPLRTERLWHLLWEVDRVEEIPMRFMGVLDQLSWDLKSKLAGLPIWQMLGGNDPVVPAYASTVTWATLDDYERHIKLCMDAGFTAFKLHAWGDVRRDIELSRALRRWTGPEAQLMFDGSAGWDYVDALVVGRALQDEGFLWYEEPMREFHLGSYAKLCDKLDIPILAAETSDGIHFNMASWIEAGALDMVRISSFYKGGFTGSLRIAHTADSFGMRAQVHGMGEANAQLCAAIANNDYYEQLVINEEQIRNLPNLGPLAITDGQLRVADSPGLGFEIDEERLDATALAKLKVDQHHW